MRIKHLILVITSLCSISTFAQNVNGKISSSFYSFERYEAPGISNNYLQNFEQLYLNIGKDNFSLKTYLNLENELSKTMDANSRLRLYNLYFEGRNLFDMANIKVGRQPIFNSIAGGLFDGVNLDVKYSDFKINGYYGGNVPAYQKFELIENWKDNFIYGGKLTIDAINDLRIQLGYVNKNFKTADYYAQRLDENLNPINYLVQSKSNQFKYASAELSYEMKHYFSLDTRVDFDFNFWQTSKIELSGSYNQIEDLGINIYYNFRQPRIRYNSIFAVFDYGNTHEIEGGVDYKLSSLFSVTGNFGYVEYKDDNAQRITVGLNSTYGNLTYRKSLGYAGEQDAISLYSGYSLFDGFITPTAGLSYTSYKLSKDSPKNNLTTVVLGTNVRPWKTFSIDLQGQYMDNKYFKNDFRLFLKLNYWFNTKLNLI